MESNDQKLPAAASSPSPCKSVSLRDQAILTANALRNIVRDQSAQVMCGATNILDLLDSHADDLMRAASLEPLPAAAAIQQPCEDCQQKLVQALEALEGMLPLAQKLFNNTVAAAREKGLPLPAWVTFDDLKFVQRARAVIASTPRSLQGERLRPAAGDK